MESAFVKGLKHALSKRYRYVIVADRGFGNERFINVLEANGFEYLIRTSSNKMVVDQEKEGMMGDICAEEKHYHLMIKKWSKSVDIYKCSNEKGVWYLISNINGLAHKKSGGDI